MARPLPWAAPVTIATSPSSSLTTAMPPVIRVLRTSSLFHIVRPAGLQDSFSILHQCRRKRRSQRPFGNPEGRQFMRQLFLKAAAAIVLLGASAAPGIAAAQAKTYATQSVFGLTVTSIGPSP